MGELEGLTPATFEQLVAGYRWREERVRDNMAWLVTRILGAWMKEPPDDLALLKREIGVSRVPGYRPQDYHRRTP